MICTAFRLMVVTDPAVFAVIGGRMTPVGEGQGTSLPRITYLLVSDPPTPPTHNGISGLAVARIQLNILAEDDPAAAALSELVRLAVVGRKGAYAGMRLDSVFRVDSHSDYESEPTVYKRIDDYKIQHTEVRP
jgi:hypothetical protein